MSETHSILNERSRSLLKYPEIDEAAGALGRALTVFQMSAGHGVPTIILGNQARIVMEAAERVHKLCEEHPDAEVTVDTRLPPGLEDQYRTIFGGNDTEIPDHLPDDFGS